jgi:uncharacterized protein with HEPN domain
LPFRDAKLHLRDIVESIDHIGSFVEGLNLAAYRTDLKSKSAVERQLQIITEAAIRLGEAAEILCPGPDWRGLRGMGNFLRHEYHKVDDKIVWNTVKDELPKLRASVLAALTPP